MVSVQFLITAFVVVIAPGTGVLYTLAVGLGRGSRAAIWAAAGCTLGILPHLFAAILGLAAVLHTSALAFQIVKFAGVAYLLYLAVQALRSGGTLDISARREREPGWVVARRGVLLNVLNPKLSLFFLALLPPFLSGDAARATTEMIVMGAVFMALTFVVFVGYGHAAAGTRDIVLARPSLTKWISRAIAASFGALALRLAVQRA